MSDSLPRKNSRNEIKTVLPETKDGMKIEISWIPMTKEGEQVFLRELKTIASFLIQADVSEGGNHEEE